MNEKNKEPLFHIVKREGVTWYQAMGVRAAAIVLALILCAVVTTLTTGANPIEVYGAIFAGAFGSVRKTWVTFQNIAILLLIALALTPAFKMRFWNIGGEGQVLIGGPGCCSLHDLPGRKASQCGYHCLHGDRQHPGRCTVGTDPCFLQGKVEYQ